MSKLGYLILFPSVKAISPSSVSSFAQDLYRAVAGLGDVPNEMTVTKEVFVQVSAARHLGAVRKTIYRLLRRHNLKGAAVVTRTP